MRLECENIICFIDETLVVLGKGDEAWCRGPNFAAMKLGGSLISK
jgi:hypothetical protein